MTRRVYERPNSHADYEEHVTLTAAGTALLRGGA